MNDFVPADLLSLWVLVGLFVGTYVAGKRRAPPAPVHRGAPLVHERVALDPGTVARALASPRSTSVHDQIRRASGARR